MTDALTIESEAGTIIIETEANITATTTTTAAVAATTATATATTTTITTTTTTAAAAAAAAAITVTAQHETISPATLQEQNKSAGLRCEQSENELIMSGFFEVSIGKTS